MHNPEHLREIGAEFLLLHIHQAEAADAGSVDNEASGGHGVHLVEGSGMLSLQVREGYLTCTDIGQSGVYRLDEG